MSRSAAAPFRRNRDWMEVGIKRSENRGGGIGLQDLTQKFRVTKQDLKFGIKSGLL